MINIFVISSIIWALFTFSIIAALATDFMKFNSKTAAVSWTLVMFLVMCAQIISGLSGFSPA